VNDTCYDGIVVIMLSTCVYGYISSVHIMATHLLVTKCRLYFSGNISTPRLPKPSTPHNYRHPLVIF